MKIDWTEWLKAEISRRFECCMGPARAYFEIPVGLFTDPDTQLARVTYVVWGCKVEGVGPNAERDLADVMIKAIDLIPIINDSPIWFWRRLPEISEEEGFTKLTIRFAIPGYDLINRRLVNLTRETPVFQPYPLYVPDGSVPPHSGYLNEKQP